MIYSGNLHTRLMAGSQLQIIHRGVGYLFFLDGWVSINAEFKESWGGVHHFCLVGWVSFDAESVGDGVPSCF